MKLTHPITAKTAFDLFRIPRWRLRQLAESGEVHTSTCEGGDGRVCNLYEADDLKLFRMDGQ